MNTDPEAIAREIVEFDARYQATRSLPLGSSERRDAFLSAMQSSIDDAPTLAAAYLDLRAQLDAVTAQRDELREAAGAFAVWQGPACEHYEDDFACGHCDACKMTARLEIALGAAR